MKQDHVEGMIKEEQKGLDAEINTLRDGLKDKMDKLAAIENRQKPSERGFGLKPIGREDQLLK